MENKWKKILLLHGLPKETDIAIMMLCKKTKAMVHTHVGDKDFFKIATGLFQVDTLAAYVFIIGRDH